MRSLKCFHLYADRMDLYGEYANLKMLSRTLEKAGYTVRIEKRSLVDVLDFTSADMIYIGSGTEAKAKTVLAHLMKYKDAFLSAYAAGTPILLTGNAMEFVGKSITDSSGKVYEALGLAPFETREGDKRLVYDQIMTLNGEKLVGFINKSSRILGNTSPLFSVNFGLGDDDESKGEGWHGQNLFATHLIGPMLVKNPAFLYEFASLILTHAGFPAPDKNAIRDEMAETAHKITLEELEKRAANEK